MLCESEIADQNHVFSVNTQDNSDSMGRPRPWGHNIPDTKEALLAHILNPTNYGLIVDVSVKAPAAKLADAPLLIV